MKPIEELEKDKLYVEISLPNGRYFTGVVSKYHITHGTFSGLMENGLRIRTSMVNVCLYSLELEPEGEDG